MGIKSVLLGFYCIVVSLQSYAHTQYFEFEGRGSGKTRDEALQAAIVDATGRADAVAADAYKMRLAVSAAFDSVSDANENLDSQILQRRVKSATKDILSSYSIIEAVENPSGGVDVAITAKVAVPNGAQSRRVRMAVLPFKSAAGMFSAEAGFVKSEDVTRRAAHALVTHLASSSRFTVLDREYIAEVFGERKITEMSSASVEDLYKAGAVLGADYIVLATVEDFSVKKETERFPELGRIVTRRTGGMSVGFRVVDMASLQVKFADTFNMKADIPENVESSEVEVGRLFGRKASLKIIEAIYPVRVLDYEDGEVIMGQGGTLVEVGARYGLFALGRHLKDPYTGEPLGRSEKRIGTIEIVRVNPDTSMGRVIERKGDINTALEKAPVVCRLVADAAAEK